MKALVSNRDHGYISYVLVLVLAVAGVSHSLFDLFNLKQVVTETSLLQNRFFAEQANLSAFSLVKAAMEESHEGKTPIKVENGIFTGEGTQLVTIESDKLNIISLIPHGNWDQVFNGKPLSKIQETLTEISLLRQGDNTIDIMAVTRIMGSQNKLTQVKTIATMALPEQVGNTSFCGDNVSGGTIRIRYRIGNENFVQDPYRVRAPCNDIELECSNFTTNICLNNPACEYFQCEFQDTFDANWNPLDPYGPWVIISTYGS